MITRHQASAVGGLPFEIPPTEFPTFSSSPCTEQPFSRLATVKHRELVQQGWRGRSGQVYGQSIRRVEQVQQATVRPRVRPVGGHHRRVRQWPPRGQVSSVMHTARLRAGGWRSLID